jgi:hypothetical protein
MVAAWFTKAAGVIHVMNIDWRRNCQALKMMNWTGTAHSACEASRYAIRMLARLGHRTVRAADVAASGESFQKSLGVD